jgi:hypothetical protein
VAVGPAAQPPEQEKFGFYVPAPPPCCAADPVAGGRGE